MATAMGMAPRYSTSALASRMMENPANQKMLRDATAGRDNRAVSNESQIMGQMIAGEQKKRMASEEIGRELAQRKDALEFARKQQEFKEEQFGQQIDRAEAARAQQAAQFQDSLSLKQNELDMQTGNQGLEMGLGLLSLGSTVFGDWKNKEAQKKELKMYRDLARTQLGISYNYSTTDTMGETDEDLAPIYTGTPKEYTKVWDRRN